METPIIVLTNNTHLWLLRGFQYLFNKYWSPSQTVTVVGYGHPRDHKVKLLDNFQFESIAPDNYPASEWTTGLIEYLRTMKHSTFILLLEDYWIHRTVDIKRVEAICRFLRNYDSKVLRVDLSADRASNKLATPFGLYADSTLVETPPHSKYQMSFQAAVWSRQLMLDILVPGETPWEAEVNGTTRLMYRPDLRVLGTREEPVKYKPIYRTHRRTVNINHLSDDDKTFILQQGWV